MFFFQALFFQFYHFIQTIIRLYELFKRGAHVKSRQPDIRYGFYSRDKRSIQGFFIGKPKFNRVIGTEFCASPDE
jgi:hypothetical protein